MTIKEILNKYAKGSTREFKELEKNREQLIQEKIAERYSLADELALINNYNLYLQDKTLLQYKDEYEEYMQYRLKVKENL